MSPPIQDYLARDFCVSGWGVVFFAFLIGHALADYPMQGAFLASAKNRHAKPEAFFGEKQAPRGLWLHALTAHALIHAGAVWFVGGSVVLAVIELVLHWLIDFAKCENRITFTTDQMLHVACKAVYAGVLTAGCLQW